MTAATDKQLFQRATFFAGAASAAALPKPRGPEVALIGRSNAGKSSLLNALAAQPKLARTSKTPGRTQQLNFFDLGSRLTLVDLPGYGFAKAAASKRLDWGELALHYLSTRDVLRRVLVLVDARRGVMPVDMSIMGFLAQHGVPFQIVLTKADALQPVELTAARQAVADTLRLAGNQEFAVIATSADKGTGIIELRAVIIEATQR